ncbi:Methylmalonyl-CoA mutase domain-containingprotein [Streptomyces hygroscopicus]|nr:Methylmalonyl-CoA mutase domain-containingprotein [Streptomyces hygroscopicus]
MKTPQQRTARAGASAAPVPGTRIAEPGLDGHDRGADVIARGLRDTGYEVLDTGPHQTPEQIVATVFAEDAALPGLSVLSGGHLTLETIDQFDAAPNQTLEPTC